MLETIIAKINKFRQSMYHLFTKRSDASFELVDALSSNTQAKTVVELSLNPAFRRNYCSITRAIDEFYPDTSNQGRQEKNQAVSQLLCMQCPSLVQRPFHLLAVDCTSNERLFSPTLADRSPVYTPHPAIAGNKPITLGHQYSVVAYLPEKLSNQAPPWVVPLSAERVSTQQKGTQVGMKQISTLLNSHAEFKDNLCVVAADSAYSTAECLMESYQHNNLVHISRLRNNRTLPRAVVTKKHGKPKRGRPFKYGSDFKLPDRRTWGKPAQTIEFKIVSPKGKEQLIKIESWKDITIRDALPIAPFRVLCIRIFKPDGSVLFQRPLWLLVSGKRRDELSLRQIFDSYRQRFDIEHFFRFGKMRLLLDQFQTPEVLHEESWWQFTMLSYTQLYLSRELAVNLPQPWEKYLPQFNSAGIISPTQVQKDFSRIISEIGTPANPPQLRNKSPGRKLGEMQIKRQRHKIVYKSNKKRAANTS